MQNLLVYKNVLLFRHTYIFNITLVTEFDGLIFNARLNLLLYYLVLYYT